MVGLLPDTWFTGLPPLQGGVLRPSMWRKAQEKKTAKKYHTRNFWAGHVTPDEHYLNRTGLRGRKRWIFFAVLIFFYLVAIGHLFVTSVILGVLRFGARGPSYLVFEENGNLLWPDGAELKEVGVASSMRAYKNESLVVTGQTQPVMLSGGVGRSGETSTLTVTQSSVTFSPYSSTLITGRSGQQLLAINGSHVVLESPPSVNTLTSTRLTTSRVLAGIGDLEIVAEQALRLRGISGVYLGGTEANITGSSDIAFTSDQGGIVLESGRVLLQGLPTVTSPQISSSTTTYHLCACASGRLFRVPMNPLRCAGARNNPCT